MPIISSLTDALLGNKPRAYLTDGHNNILFNVLTEESESDTCEITDHAIESGSSVSDHSWLKPKELSLKIILTDDIVSLDDPIQALAEGMTLSGFIKSIPDRMDTLQIWLYQKTLLTYMAHLPGPVEDLDFVVQSVTRTHNTEVGDNIALDLVLKQVTIAESLTSNVTIAGQASTGTHKKAGSGSPKRPSSTIFTWTH